MADSAIVGRILGVNAFAAVGATVIIYSVASSAIISMAHGFGVVLAQRFGAKDKDGLCQAFITSICLIVIFGIAVGLVGVLLSEFLLVTLNTPAVLLDNAVIYLSWLLGGMAVTAVYHLFSSALLALGESRAATRIMVFVSLLNIAFSLALVVPFGIAGSAIAMLLAQFVGIFYCLFVLRRAGIFTDGCLKWDTAISKDLLRLGLPLGFRDSLIQIGGLAVQWHINNFGVEFIAGVAIAKRMYSLLFIASGAFEAAAATFAAHNFGAGKYDRVKLGVAAGTRLMLASAAVTMVLTLLFGRFILGLMFDGEPHQVNAVLDIGVRQLVILTIGLPIAGMLFLYRATLEGMGKSVVSMISGFLEMFFRVALVLLLVPIAGEWGIFILDPVGWVAATVLLVITYNIVLSRLKPNSYYSLDE